VIRLVLSDVDGTLADPLTDDVSERVCRAFRQVDAAGLSIGFATGRTTASLKPIIDQIGLREAWAICSNGAVLARYSEDIDGGFNVIRQTPFEPAEAVRRLMSRVPDAIVAAWNGNEYLTTQPFPPGELIAERVVSLADVVARPTTKAVLRWLNRTRGEVHAQTANLDLPEGVDAILSKFTAWMDLLPWGISKAAAAGELVQWIGIEQGEVLAIGDDYNDIDFLRWAGRGVAMGGSPPAVLDAADEVTASIEDDGAAVVLEGLVSSPDVSHGG